VETPRKFITAVINLPGLFPQTKVLYVLSPCKPTKNLSLIIHDKNTKVRSVKEFVYLM
jgi:hypothetical protein